MNETFIFIYSKEGKIKALDVINSKMLHPELIKEGWVHTTTLDACVYLEHLHNSCEDADLIDEMKSLSKKLNQ